MKLGRISLRTRLAASAVIGATIALTVLILAFNLVLDAVLRTDADNVLRERAATVLRGLGTVDGRLSVIEAPDQGAIDAETWIFAGGRTLELPAGADPRTKQAAEALASSESRFETLSASDTRLHAVAVRQGGRRLGTVVVGTSVSPYESTASSALLGSVALGLLMLAAIAALSRWLIGRALRPVARMSAQAADWGERDLSRRFFAGEPHDELTSLAWVFDGLLARLAESLRREQRLTAEVSHELRTPLAKILAESELAAGRERSSPEYRASLQAITRHAQELQGVLETLLASARAAGSGRPAAGDALQAAVRAAALLEETAAADGKSIEVTGARPAMVALETDLVERILAPLLENAVRYARDHITLEILRVEGNVVVEIRDDGPGVRPRERETIFDPGFRGSASQAGADVGAGLGLALARRLARDAGGEVQVSASTTGASFAVRLPAA